MFNLGLYRNAIAWVVNLKDDVLKSKSLIYVIIVAASLSLVFGFTFYLIDPNVKSLGDGIWFSWVSITHVGYGDIVPTSFIGRLLGAALILLGIGMFALFTASFSAALIGRDLINVKHEMASVEKEARHIERDDTLILNELAKLHQRLEKLEAALIDKEKD